MTQTGRSKSRNLIVHIMKIYMKRCQSSKLVRGCCYLMNMSSPTPAPPSLAVISPQEPFRAAIWAAETMVAIGYDISRSGTSPETLSQIVRIGATKDGSRDALKVNRCHYLYRIPRHNVGYYSITGWGGRIDRGSLLIKYHNWQMRVEVF